MDRAARDLLFELLAAPGPAGHEGAVQQLVHDRWGGFADTVETDLHGNLILGLNPDTERRVMLAGHADQIGFMVVRIDDSGFLQVEEVGGTDAGVIPGSRAVVHTAGGPLPGVFGKPPVHLQSQDEQAQVRTIGSLWIDVGATGREDAERRVRPGDYVTFQPAAVELLNGRLASPGLDNRAGLWVVLEAFRRCAEAELNFGLFAVSTVQEELGCRGAATAAAALRPEVGIAVDVTFALDDPTSGSQTKAACTLGGGPCISHGPNTNPVVGRMLREAADRAGVEYQLTPTGELEGNDAKALQQAGFGVATATVGIPQRYMHTTAEVCDLTDIESAARLLAEFARGLPADADFRPFRPGRAAPVSRRGS